MFKFLYFGDRITRGFFYSFYNIRHTGTKNKNLLQFIDSSSFINALKKLFDEKEKLLSYNLI